MSQSLPKSWYFLTIFLTINFLPNVLSIDTQGTNSLHFYQKIYKWLSSPLMKRNSMPKLKKTTMRQTLFDCNTLVKRKMCKISPSLGWAWPPLLIDIWPIMISWLLEIDHFAQIKRTNKKNKLGHHIEINKLSCENSFLLRNVLSSVYKNQSIVFMMNEEFIL